MTTTPSQNLTTLSDQALAEKMGEGDVALVVYDDNIAEGRCSCPCTCALALAWHRYLDPDGEHEKVLDFDLIGTGHLISVTAKNTIIDYKWLVEHTPELTEFVNSFDNYDLAIDRYAFTIPAANIRSIHPTQEQQDEQTQAALRG